MLIEFKTINKYADNKILINPDYIISVIPEPLFNHGYDSVTNRPTSEKIAERVRVLIEHYSESVILDHTFSEFKKILASSKESEIK